jgi:uncharacterized membrane protein YuzA (DUF378 family)
MNTLKHLCVSIGILCASHIGVTNHFRLLGNQIGSVKPVPVAAAVVVGGAGVTAVGKFVSQIADDGARWFGRARPAIEKSQRIYNNEHVQGTIGIGRLGHKAKQGYDKSFPEDR